MNAPRKYFRLLPAVFAVGIGLLTIKGIDLARAAQSTASDAPDNTGLAPDGTGGAKPATDIAVDDSANNSSAAVDVLTSLTRRRAELDAHERALNMRENVLAAGEDRVDQKIGALKNLQTDIQALLSQRDAAQDKQIGSLVKTYSSMKPKDAARIFDSLADEVLLPVAKGMKSDALAPVMAAMNPQAAQRLTVKLAALLKLPEAPPAEDCPAAPAPTPASSANAPPLSGAAAAVAPATSAPLQTVALVPPTAPSQATPAPQATPLAATPSQAVAPRPKTHKPAPRKIAAVKPAVTISPAPAANAAVAPPANPAPAPVSLPPPTPDTHAAATPDKPAATPANATSPASQANATPPAATAIPPQASQPPAAITPAKGS